MDEEPDVSSDCHAERFSALVNMCWKHAKNGEISEAYKLFSGYRQDFVIDVEMWDPPTGPRDSNVDRFLQRVAELLGEFDEREKFHRENYHKTRANAEQQHEKCIAENTPDSGFRGTLDYINQTLADALILNLLILARALEHARRRSGVRIVSPD